MIIRSGLRSAAVAASAVRDLRKYDMSMSLRCGPLYGVTNNDAIQIDSIDVPAITIDTVHYGAWFADGDRSVGFGYVVWSGVGTRFLRNGTTEPLRVSHVRQELRYQGPRTITWIEGNWDFGFTQTDAAPITYEGSALDWCFRWGGSHTTRRLALTLSPQTTP